MIELQNYDAIGIFELIKRQEITAREAVQSSIECIERQNSWLNAVIATDFERALDQVDSGGSIRIPASNCGLFGLKPSRARVPLGNDMPEGLAGFSTWHAVTHSVRDSALLLDLICRSTAR